jgi:hypothetical protein
MTSVTNRWRNAAGLSSGILLAVVFLVSGLWKLLFIDVNNIYIASRTLPSTGAYRRLGVCGLFRGGRLRRVERAGRFHKAGHRL